MGIFYKNLDAKCRQCMLEELKRDILEDCLYIGSFLNEVGSQGWAALLEKAIQDYDDIWLENELRARNYIKNKAERKKPKGGFTVFHVPVTAPQMLAEGEFNRFYARGLCSIAIANNAQEVVVYRGKEVRQPRAESEGMIGKRINAKALLEDLRKSQGVEPALGIPAGPNSGLTICLA